MGNVTGLVTDEKSIFPKSLNRVLKDIGFKNIVVRGLHFNHVRFPVSIQLLSLLIDYPFRVTLPFKYFANGIGWYCEKLI